jgi:hypothetical protein
VIARGGTLAALALAIALAVAAPGHAAAHHRPRSAKCPAGGSTAGVCTVPRAPCVHADASIYAAHGLVCRGGRLAKGGLAVQRDGGAFAVDAKGHVELPEAEQAFIAAFAPLPGVKPIPGAVDLAHESDLTGPLTWIEHYLPRLTPPQQRAVRKVLTRIDTPPKLPRGAARASLVKDELLNIEQPKLEERISALTGITLPFKPTVWAGTPADLTIDPKKGFNLGLADPVQAPGGKVVGCKVRVLESLTESVPETLNTEGHELTHCFEFAAAGTVQKFNALPEFLVEGFAEWAGDQLEFEIKGVDDHDTRGESWVDNPWRSLFVREHDAFPLYDEMEEYLGGPSEVWKLLQPMVTAGSAKAVYEYLNATAGPDFQRDLATKSVFDPSLGEEWTFTGLGISTFTKPPLLTAVVGNGDSTTLGAAAYAGNRAKLRLDADVIDISGKAPGGVHLPEGSTIDPEPVRICIAPGGCTCPDGTDPTEADSERGLAIVAIWGQDAGNELTISGESLEEACAEGVPASVPTPSGGSGGRVRFENVQGQTLASFESKATCSLSGATLIAKLANRGGGQPLTVTLPGFTPGHSIRLSQFTDPAAGGPVVRYPPYTTDAPVIGGDGEPANAGDWGYDGGTRFSLAAILFLPGTETGGFADGSFNCASLAAGAPGG